MYKISPTIDSKVCNKKVAVDDEGPTVHARGDSEPVPTQRDAQHQPWSCVDYVDAEHRGDKAPTKERRAAKPPTGDDGLRMRFGEITRNVTPHDDEDGRCVKYVDGSVSKGG